MGQSAASLLHNQRVSGVGGLSWSSSSSNLGGQSEGFRCEWSYHCFCNLGRSATRVVFNRNVHSHLDQLFARLKLGCRVKGFRV